MATTHFVKDLNFSYKPGKIFFEACFSLLQTLEMDGLSPDKLFFLCNYVQFIVLFTRHQFFSHMFRAKHYVWKSSGTKHNP